MEDPEFEGPGLKGPRELECKFLSLVGFSYLDCLV